MSLHVRARWLMPPNSNSVLVNAAISLSPHGFIGKYLSCLRKLHHVIAPQEGFEAQLRAPRLPITVEMSALGMTRQIGEGRLQRVIEPCHVPGLQGLDNPA